MDDRSVKAVILIGGPQKGTRFRPLSFDMAKPLFPVAGRPMIQHLIEACCQVKQLSEIILLGFFQLDSSLSAFIDQMNREYGVSVKYLQEYTHLGTGGGIYHFRDVIRRGNPAAFFLMNGDVCGQFPLTEMLQFHQSEKRLLTILSTEAIRQESLNYGCIVEDKTTNCILHYVEKPSTFISSTINCGIYLCDLTIFEHLAHIYKEKLPTNLNRTCNGSPTSPLNGNLDVSDNKYLSINNLHEESISLEREVLTPLAGRGLIYACHTNTWWSQIKTAASAIYASRYYLSFFHQKHPEFLSTTSNQGPTIIGDVYIHESASVDPTATLGPNVSIGQGAKIGAGVRIRESIILADVTIREHTLITNSIIGWKSTIGCWSRIEGTPCDPNPNKPFAKVANSSLFTSEGKLNPSVTVLGSSVQVPSETLVLNSVVLPHKELTRSYKNEIIL